MVSANALQRDIAKRVAAARVGNRMTKVELADALGLSKQGYNPYEQGKGTFTIEQLFKLARILGRSVEYFLGLDNGLTTEQDELLTLYENLPNDQARRWALEALRAQARLERKQK